MMTTQPGRPPPRHRTSSKPPLVTLAGLPLEDFVNAIVHIDPNLHQG